MAGEGRERRALVVEEEDEVRDRMLAVTRPEERDWSTIPGVAMELLKEKFYERDGGGKWWERENEGQFT